MKIFVEKGISHPIALLFVLLIYSLSLDFVSILAQVSIIKIAIKESAEIALLGVFLDALDPTVHNALTVLQTI